MKLPAVQKTWFNAVLILLDTAALCLVTEIYWSSIETFAVGVGGVLLALLAILVPNTNRSFLDWEYLEYGLYGVLVVVAITGILLNFVLSGPGWSASIPNNATIAQYTPLTVHHPKNVHDDIWVILYQPRNGKYFPATAATRSHCTSSLRRRTHLLT